MNSQNRNSLSEHGRDIRKRLGEIPFVPPRFVTWFTGKPTSTEDVPQRTLFGQLFVLAFAITAGLAFSLLFASNGIWFAVPIGWLSIAHGMRSAQVYLVHRLAHRQVFGDPVDRVLGSIISHFLLLTEFHEYQHGHVYYHHNNRLLSGQSDPTVQALLWAGLKPGMSKSTLYLRLICSCISPVYHTKTLIRRISTYYSWKHPVNALAMAVYLIVLGVLVWWFPITFGCGLLLPALSLYQVFSLLRLTVEHHWPAVDGPKSSEDLHGLTSAIFCGSCPPDKGESLRSWILWCVAMCGHLFVRLTILVGDTVVHDAHHKCPKDDWLNYERARFEAASRAPSDKYDEVWGFLNALDLCFSTLSQSSLRQVGSFHSTNIQLS